MWNDQPAPPGYPPSQPHTGGYDNPLADPDAPHWSPEQLTRLEGEWRRLQRSFAYHPHVTVQPLRGDPPGEYQIDYRLTTLVIDEAGQLQYANGASVHLWLPPEFPNHPPLVRPLTGLFHPNVSWEGFHLESAWQPGDTLVNLVRRIGDLLTYRIFDPNSVVNGPAMDWLNANAQSLPLDGQANFAPSAGGEPLGKIIHFGGQSIESIRQSLQAMQSQLLSRNAPDPAAVRDYSLRTRLALDLFLDGDVPEVLRSAASSLHECARELPSAMPSYDYLRGRRASLEALRTAAKSALESKSTLTGEMKKLAGLVQLPEGLDPEGTHDPNAVLDPGTSLRLIPEPAVLQPFQLRLPKQIAEAERRVEAVRAGLRALEREPGPQGPQGPQAMPSDTMLGAKLEQEFAAVASDTEIARAEASDALAVAEPVVKRAREDSAALDQIARYREHVDLLARGRELERRLADWGGEGVQAYYIQSGADRFGPFQFEQPVDLGGAGVVVRNATRGSIEVFDADTEVSLGQGADGKVTVPIGEEAKDAEAEGESDGGEGNEGNEGNEQEGKSYPMTFQLTERCDDLLVQLDFLRRQTQESIEKPDPAANASPSWCGALCRQLSAGVARNKVKKDMVKVSLRWRSTMLDLAALNPVKERVVTYHLLARTSEMVPALVRTIKEARAALKESDKRMADIVRRCSRDVETDRLIVPAKYDKPYQAELKLREEVSGRQVKGATLLKALVLRLTKRLKEPKLLGRAGTPSLRVMRPLPPAIESLPLTDDDLGDRIVELETLLKTSLGGPRPNPNRPRVAERVAEPVREVGGEAAGEGGAEVESGAVEQQAAVGEFGAAEMESQGQYAEGGDAESAVGEAEPAEPAEHGHDEHAGHAESGGDDFVVFDEPEQA